MLYFAVYLLAAISATVRGMLTALGAFAMDVHHYGIFIALGIIGAALHLVVLIVGYLRQSKHHHEKRPLSRRPLLPHHDL